VGVIVHAVSNRVLSNNTAKNIYGNVNYAKTFLQGTIINVFDERAPGGKNAVWKLTVNFQMPSEDPVPGVESSRVDIHRHWQHCTLGPVPADELNQLARAGALSDCLCISITSSSPCSRLTVASPPLSPAIVIIATAVVARRGQGRQWRLPSTSWSSLSLSVLLPPPMLFFPPPSERVAVTAASGAPSAAQSSTTTPSRRTLRQHRRSHRRA
jgi:hypothetical protein